MIILSLGIITIGSYFLYGEKPGIPKGVGIILIIGSVIIIALGNPSPASSSEVSLHPDYSKMQFIAIIGGKHVL